MPVPIEVTLQPTQAFEVVAFLPFLSGWRFRLRPTVWRNESHPDFLGFGNLRTGQFTGPIFEPQCRYPEPNPPTEPYLVGLGAGVSVIPGIGSQSCETSVKIYLSSTHVKMVANDWNNG